MRFCCPSTFRGRHDLDICQWILGTLLGPLGRLAGGISLRVKGVILLMEPVVSRFLESSTISAAPTIQFGFFKEVIASFNPLSTFFICTTFRLICTCVLTKLLGFKVPPRIFVFDTHAAPLAAVTSAAKVF